MLTNHSNVPYDAALNGWLRLHDVPLDSLVQHSRRYERAYLAWETVRQVRNPFFNIGTGFEGYFVGICHSAEEVIAQLLDIGRGMLVSNARLYRYQYTFRACLMKTLTGECSDPHAIQVWSALFGAALGKLRCNIYYNASTWRFQNETYWMVNRLPFIQYDQCDHHIEQVYALIPFSGNVVSRPDLPLELLNPAKDDATLVVSRIAAFGHPLIRAYLDDLNNVTPSFLW